MEFIHYSRSTMPCLFDASQLARAVRMPDRSANDSRFGTRKTSDYPLPRRPARCHVPHHGISGASRCTVASAPPATPGPRPPFVRSRAALALHSMHEAPAMRTATQCSNHMHYTSLFHDAPASLSCKYATRAAIGSASSAAHSQYGTSTRSTKEGFL